MSMCIRSCMTYAYMWLMLYTVNVAVNMDDVADGYWLLWRQILGLLYTSLASFGNCFFISKYPLTPQMKISCPCNSWILDQLNWLQPIDSWYMSFWFSCAACIKQCIVFIGNATSMPPMHHMTCLHLYAISIACSADYRFLMFQC